MVKVKRIHQVGHVVAAPLRQRLGPHVFVAVGGGPGLDKLNVRGVVCKLGEDVAASRPGRDDEPGRSPAYT